MTTAAATHQRLDELWSLRQHGDWSHALQGELDQLLSQDSQLENTWTDYCLLEADLQETQSEGKTQSGKEQAPPSGSPIATFTAKSQTYFPALLKIAALLMLGAFLHLAWQTWNDTQTNVVTKSSTPSPLAILTNQENAQWEGLTLQPGAALGPQRLILKSGSAQLVLGGQTKIDLQGPAEFEIVSAQESLLHRGQLSALQLQSDPYSPPSPAILTAHHHIHGFQGKLSLATHGDHDLLESHTGTLSFQTLGNDSSTWQVQEGATMKAWHQPPPADQDWAMVYEETFDNSHPSSETQANRWHILQGNQPEIGNGALHMTFSASSPSLIHFNQHFLQELRNKHYRIEIEVEIDPEIADRGWFAMTLGPHLNVDQRQYHERIFLMQNGRKTQRLIPPNGKSVSYHPSPSEDNPIQTMTIEINETESIPQILSSFQGKESLQACPQLKNWTTKKLHFWGHSTGDILSSAAFCRIHHVRILEKK